ncbi:hypothetical protein OKW21_003463 [Catalinimonas alkaloidigena]|uniref:hypothetical protein n=1 Tax=Catalinimonas alkaloidigena TaxID=1075417 RepID=UPI002406B0D8|nr:hypothetical protein [Catalinimonas alkaloidigena]MDF9798200.1 hypothetical protein [Catalinimonas alkaloidigena]
MRLSFIPALLFGLLIFSCSSNAQDIPNKDEQIQAAVIAAPEDKRAEATVLGFDAEGKLVTLREGSNNMICLGDDPNSAGFNAACYHKDLEPFMARGRALKAEGKSPQEIFDIREEEAKSGQLAMPENPSTLHVLSGKEGKYNAESESVENANYRYVVYIPFATAESTGLPESPVVPGGPWIMDPGTHRAHIMISTPAQE